MDVGFLGRPHGSPARARSKLDAHIEDELTFTVTSLLVAAYTRRNECRPTPFLIAVVAGA